MESPAAPTRPSSDKIKEAMFSIVASLGPFDRVLDLYAGSGALGIEALSRWGGDATFVDASERACATIRQNLERTRLGETARVVRTSAEHAVRHLVGPYDLVLADPPYQDEGIDDLLLRMGSSEIVAKDGVVVLEHSVRFAAQQAYGTLSRWKSRRHGDTVLTLYVPSSSPVRPGDDGAAVPEE